MGQTATAAEPRGGRSKAAPAIAPAVRSGDLAPFEWTPLSGDGALMEPVGAAKSSSDRPLETAPAVRRIEILKAAGSSPRPAAGRNGIQTVSFQIRPAAGTRASGDDAPRAGDHVRRLRVFAAEAMERGDAAGAEAALRRILDYGAVDALRESNHKTTGATE